MAGRTYSLVQKLAGAAIAKLKGADAAATELSTDRRTIRRWLAAAPDDGWMLARDLAQARLHEQLASGKVNAAQLATVAGIAERNVRYGELLRRREARGEAEPEQAPPDPIHDAIHALRDDQRTLMAGTIRLEIERRALAEAKGERPPPAGEGGSAQESDERMLAFIAEVAAGTPEKVRVELRAVVAKRKTVREQHEAAANAHAEQQRAVRQSEPPPPVPDAPEATPPQPKLRAVDEAGEPWQWQPYRRYDL